MRRCKRKGHVCRADDGKPASGRARTVSHGWREAAGAAEEQRRKTTGWAVAHVPAGRSAAGRACVPLSKGDTAKRGSADADRTGRVAAPASSPADGFKFSFRKEILASAPRSRSVGSNSRTNSEPEMAEAAACCRSRSRLSPLLQRSFAVSRRRVDGLLWFPVLHASIAVHEFGHLIAARPVGWRRAAS